MTSVLIDNPEADQSRLGLSALRVDERERGHFFTDFFAPRPVIERFLDLAERDGLIISNYKSGDESYAVLDVLDSTGDIITDRLVPTETAWQALNSELRLRVREIEGGGE